MVLPVEETPLVVVLLVPNQLAVSMPDIVKELPLIFAIVQRHELFSLAMLLPHLKLPLVAVGIVFNVLTLPMELIVKKVTFVGELIEVHQSPEPVFLVRKDLAFVEGIELGN